MDKFLDLYANFLRRELDLKKPIKVVFDCSNGTTGLVLKKVKIPNSYLIHNKPDGRFPAHGPNPLAPGALTDLKKAVLSKKADLGVAFDADGDRAFFIDNKGRVLPAHLVAKLILSDRKSSFVADIMVFKAMEKSGMLRDRRGFPSRVGTYFIKSLMRRHESDLGVEVSGHYHFKDFFYSDSGIWAFIKLANAISRLNHPLSDFLDSENPKIYLENFDVLVKNQKLALAKINKVYGNRAKKIQKIDGLTFEFGSFWITVRPSNTEPLLRFFVGGLKAKEVGEKIKELKNLVNSLI